MGFHHFCSICPSQAGAAALLDPTDAAEAAARAAARAAAAAGDGAMAAGAAAAAAGKAAGLEDAAGWIATKAVFQRLLGADDSNW